MPADLMNFPRHPGNGDFTGRSSRFVQVIAIRFRRGARMEQGWNPSPYRMHTPHDDARFGDTRLKPGDQNGVAAETIAALRAGWADATRIVLEGSGANTACSAGAESASTLVTSPLAHNKRA